MRQLVFAVLIIAATALAWWPSLDAHGNATVDAAFKRALVTWALARGLNGVLSVAQGTEVAIQPAGVGVNFTPGEILDPVNDLVERFSWIMMLATSSLGIQQILLAMSAWQGLIIALTIAAVFAIAARYWLQNPRLVKISGRVFLFLLLLRFMMPAIALANQWVYNTFLDADYQSASSELSLAQEKISDLNDAARDAHAGDGIDDDGNDPLSTFRRAREALRRIGDAVRIDKRMEDYRIAAERISENTIRLVVVFLMQTVVFPMVFLFVVVGFIKRIVNTA